MELLGLMVREVQFTLVVQKRQILRTSAKVESWTTFDGQVLPRFVLSWTTLVGTACPRCQLQRRSILSHKFSMTDTDSTVLFDIGGRVFKVRRALLDSFPSTILARAASEQWQGDETDKAIFMDRDSERFRYCLDYMRDGKVELPLRESKLALLKDLEYYGFENVDSKSIEITCNAIEAADYLFQFERMTKEENEHAQFAHIFFCEYRKTGNLQLSVPKQIQSSAYEFCCNRLQSDQMNEALKKYGLRVGSVNNSSFSHSAVTLERLS